MEKESEKLICALCEPPNNNKGTLVKSPTAAQVEELKKTVKERVELGETKLKPYHEYLQNEDSSRIRY